MSTKKASFVFLFIKVLIVIIIIISSSSSGSSSSSSSSSSSIGLVNTSETVFCDEKLTSHPAVYRYLKDTMLIASICAVY